MSWLRYSTFLDVTAVHGYLECSLPVMSLSLLLKYTTGCLTVFTSTGWSASWSMNVNRYHFFPHGGIHLHTFASCTLPCQTPVCQTAPLLPPIAWQRKVIEYWRKGSTSAAIPPPSTSDVMSQNNKIECTTFGVVLIYMCVCVCMHVLHSFSWIHPNPIRMVIGTLTDFSYSSFHIPRLQFSVLSNVRLLNASFCFENIWYGAF